MDVRNSVGTTFIRPSSIRERDDGYIFRSPLVTGMWAMIEKQGLAFQTT